MPCQKDCKGCLCHVKAPCDHHREGHLDDSPEAEADREEKRRLRVFFFGNGSNYRSILFDKDPRPFICAKCYRLETGCYDGWCTVHGFYLE